MDLHEISGLIYIFYELIQGFIHKEEDEPQLRLIVQGLSNLVKCQADQAEEVYSGRQLQKPEFIIQTVAALLEHQNE